MAHRAWPPVAIEPAAPASLGWAAVGVGPAALPDLEGAIDHANSGTVLEENYSMFNDLYAGVVAYGGGDVVWLVAWEPLFTDTAPELIPLADGRVQVRVSGPAAPDVTRGGTATISASVDGLAAADSIVLTMGTGFYVELAWGPAP